MDSQDFSHLLKQEPTMKTLPTCSENDEDMEAKKEHIKKTLVNLQEYLEKLKTYIHKKYIEPENANQNANNDSQCHNGVRAV
jgi:hypothetical protein